MKTAATVLAALIALMLGVFSCTPPANSAESTPGCVRSGGGWLCYGTTPPTP